MANIVTDACAAGAVCLAGVSLTTVDHVVQIVAGVLASIAAAISIARACTDFIRKRRAKK